MPLARLAANRARRGRNDVEDRPGRVVVDAQAKPVQFDDRRCHAEPKTRAGQVARALRAIETLVDLVAFAGAAVADLDQGVCHAAGDRHLAAARRELDGAVDKVDQCLAQQIAITSYDDRRLGVEAQGDMPFDSASGS